MPIYSARMLAHVERRGRPSTRGWLFAATMLLLASTELALGFGLAQAGTSATGVQVALMPAAQTVSLGADVFVDIDVTQLSQGYNLWSGTLTFDPTALTYIPTTPAALQQGCLMTGDCSNACGNYYLEVTPTVTSPSADTVKILNSLVCYQTLVTAPGALFRLHFKAANTAKQATVSFRRLVFADGVQYLSPVIWSPAQIGIGMAPLAVDPSTPSSGLRLSATPNPARGEVTLALGSEHSGEQELAVHDVLGRTVRVISRSWQAAGDRQLTWDGRDQSGSRAAPGVYLVTLRVGSYRTQSRITLLD